MFSASSFVSLFKMTARDDDQKAIIVGVEEKGNKKKTEGKEERRRRTWLESNVWALGVVVSRGIVMRLIGGGVRIGRRYWQ